MALVHGDMLWQWMFICIFSMTVFIIVCMLMPQCKQFLVHLKNTIAC